MFIELLSMDGRNMLVNFDYIRSFWKHPKNDDAIQVNFLICTETFLNSYESIIEKIVNKNASYIALD